VKIFFGARARMIFMTLSVEQMLLEHWPEVRAVYAEGLATGDATFETEAPEWERWDAAHLRACRLVALSGGRVAGWAALSPVSARKVYAGVAEVSVYVGEGFRGRGLGRALLSALVRESEGQGIWTLQASIFPENVLSVALHRACGFREVGRRERIGQLAGRWRDTILLERRSRTVGV
jgi:phosphinothricin acetyltransferase